LYYNLSGKLLNKAKKPTSKETSRTEKRRTVIEAIQRGEPVTVVARVHGLPLRTVFLWLAKYRQGGWHALTEGKRSGRPAKVSGPILAWLYKAITLGDPRQYHFEFCLWTLQIIRQMLRQEHGIQLSKSAVSRLLAQLGLSPQRPLYKSYKQDPKKIQRYLQRTFPGLREEARRVGAVIYFVDEASVRSDSHRGTTWGKLGETPVVRDSGDRFGIRLISAVSPRGDMKFAAFEGRMTGARFVAFLKKLRADAGRPIIVIADNASYHTGKVVQAYCKESAGEVTVANLPAYAPELNPDEQVWNHAKGRLAKLAITTRGEMSSAVRNILRSIQATIALVLSFFQLKDTKYAALI
jgi:transposase